MTRPEGNHDDPLDRLAAEEDWRARVRAVETEVSRARRKARIRQWRPVPSQRRSAPVMEGRGVSKIFLGLVAVFLISGSTLWFGIGPASLTVFVFVLSGWLVTLCLHEFSHALTAHRSGDDTVAAKGYLRLDPRRYGHWLLTLVLPLFFLVIGGLPLPGGAVLIETHRLRNRFRDALVSAAGPAVNIVAAAILLIVVSVFGPFWIDNLSQPHAAFWAALTFLAYLQVATAILNLIPMPGLDGYGMIEPYLAASTRRIGNKIKPFGVIALFVLLYLPPVRDAFGGACTWFLDVSGAPVNGDYFGYRLFQFWKDILPTTQG
ncbi:MAG TPA: site-2 protease family protein [Micromonosporaceae bacterium]|nr:site-2 protease family protein [Micromonosporaceae bacterium]HCU51573.1 site-2 protease family protein [Micromonosporaceae bacterium]